MNQILRRIELLRNEVPDWKIYPFSIPVIKTLDQLDFDERVTIFAGENGSGKSTLIEAIAIKAGFNPEGGTRNFSSAHRPSESNLKIYLRLARGIRREKGGFFLRAETMFNVSTEAEAYAMYGWEKLHEKSHGEAFLWLVMNRFKAGGLYILDEPEAALSPQRQLVLLARMRELVDQGAQFILSTHSPILMAFPAASIFLLTDEGIQNVRYEETEHYMVTKAFLMNPTRMLNELWGRPDDVRIE